MMKVYHKVTKELCVEALKKANKEIDGLVTAKKYTSWRVKKKEEGKYYPTQTSIAKHFGFDDLKRELGLEIHNPVKYPKEKIIEYLHNYVEEKGKVPTLKEFMEYVGFSPTPIYDNFQNYDNFLIYCGYKEGEYKEVEEFKIPDFCVGCLENENCDYDYNLDECIYYEGVINE